MSDMLDEATYRNQIAEMKDRDLAVETAMQVYRVCRTCQNHADMLGNHAADIEAQGKDIVELKSRDKKAFGVSGGIGTGIGTALGAFFYFLYTKVPR